MDKSATPRDPWHLSMAKAAECGFIQAMRGFPWFISKTMPNYTKTSNHVMIENLVLLSVDASFGTFGV